MQANGQQGAGPDPPGLHDAAQQQYAYMQMPAGMMWYPAPNDPNHPHAAGAAAGGYMHHGAADHAYSQHHHAQAAAAGASGGMQMQMQVAGGGAVQLPPPAEHPPAGCAPDAYKLFVGNVPRAATEQVC